MRYVITHAPRDPQAPRLSTQAASNRALANVLYDERVRAVVPTSGQVVQLTDTKTGKVLLEHRDLTATELAERRTKTLARVPELLARDAASAVEELEKFIATLGAQVAKADGDPTYGLEWAARQFETAAMLYVRRCALARLTAGATVGAVVEEARTEALRGARHPSQSTSVTANLVATCKMQAWARLAEQLAWYAKVEADQEDA